MLEIIKHPWPWYVAGPLIGLTVPALLVFGNKAFGISSSFRHLYAACIPTKLPFFVYNWKKELWNLAFVLGMLIGGFTSHQFLTWETPLALNPNTVTDLKALGIRDFSGLLPSDLFSLQVWNPKGILLMVLGGFLIGFGTRYAGGCTSGHAIMGLSNLQWPSLVATICFMIGGFVGTYILLPLLLSV